MSKDSGETQTTTTVNNMAPWTAAQPFLTTMFQKGLNYANTAPSTLVAPFSPQSLNAMGRTEQRALNGSPVMNSAENLAGNTLQGQFLSPDSNPFLGQYLKRGMEGITPSINATFSGAGRTGSDAHASALGRAAGDFASQLYGGAYDAERGRQMQTMGMAPSFAAQDYADLNALLGVGQQQEAKQQQLMDMPWTQLSRYAGLMGNGFGSSGTSTASQPIYNNPLGSAMGGAMMGGQLFGPWGALGGGLLGGIFG